MRTTATRTISRSLVEAAIMNADLDADAIRDDYSGRGMYGGTCWGLRLDNAADVGLFYFQLGALAFDHQENDETGAFDMDDVAEMVRRSASDSLGRGTIVYFPGYTLEG